MDQNQINGLKTVLLGIGGTAAVLTLREANKLQFAGAKIYPLGWAIAAFFTLGLSTPVFLIVRSTVWTPQVAARKERQRAREQAG